MDMMTAVWRCCLLRYLRFSGASITALAGALYLFSLSFSEEPVTSSLAAHQATRTQTKCCAKLLVYWAKELRKWLMGHTTESGCLNFFHNGQLPSQA